MTYLFFFLMVGLLTWFFIKLGDASKQCFANEATAETEGFKFSFFSNEAKADTADNWVQLSPYGRFPNASGLQVFTKQDALNICNEFTSAAAVGTRILGIPFYVGHPDHEAFKDVYKDKRAYGRIKTLEARDTGLFANVRWSGDAKQMIQEEAYHGHSVNWRMKKIGGEWHPVSLKSVGFTNDPQIPVEPITAANEKQENIMDKKLIAKALGLSEESTEEQIITAVNEAQKNVVAYAAFKTALTTAGVKTEASDILAVANEVKALKEKNVIDSTEAANEKKRADQEKARADKAVIDFANERKARAGVLISTALTQGRITAAEKVTYETEFANESTFEATVTKLASAKAKLPTNSRVNGVVSGITPESRGKVEQISEFVNEVQAQNPKLSHMEATAMAKKKKPELFERTVAA